MTLGKSFIQSFIDDWLTPGSPGVSISQKLQHEAEKTMATKKVNTSSALVPTSTQVFAAMAKAPAIGALDRSSWVKSRLVSISKEASERYFENGLLLQEIKSQKYWKEWEYESFNDAIDCLHEAGMLEYGSRNARNFIAVVEMQQTLGVPLADVVKLPISKLREICSVPDDAAKVKLLTAANEMDVSEVQLEAKKLRHKAKGKDVDPLMPLTLMVSVSMREFFKECMAKARSVYAVNPDTSDATVLVDMVLADWFNSTPQIEAEVIEAEAS